MNEKDNLNFLDIMNIMSFIIGMMNYNENLTQGDKQELMQAFDKQTSVLLENIHNHLDEQDKRLEAIENDIRRGICKDSSASD